MSYLRLTEQASPGVQSPGKVAFFVDPTDGRPKMVNDENLVLTMAPFVKDNLLGNEEFLFAQRQAPGTLTTYSSVGGRTYGADRWWMSNENASIQYQRVDTSTTPESGITSRFYGKFKKITSAGKIAIGQVLEGVEACPLRGRNVRLQVKMKYSVAASMTVRLGLVELQNAGTIDTVPSGAGLYITAFNADLTDPTLGTDLAYITPILAENGTITGDGVTCVLTAGWVRYSAVFTVPANCKNLIPMIFSHSDLAANDELNLAEVGLYVGNEASDFEVQNVADSLARCQRYFSKTFATDTAPAQNIGASTGEHRVPATVAGAATNRLPSWYYPVTMRTTPTLTSFNPSAANAQVRDETSAADCSATTFVGSNDGSTMITCTANAGTAVGELLGVHITADAEL